MNVDIRIRSLVDRPEQGAQLAEWFRAEWGGHFQHWTTQKIVEEYFTPSTSVTGLPVILVAETAGRPIGSVMLRSHWRDSRRELGPWLGGLYVQPEYRGQAVARRLMEALAVEAKRRGYTSIYSGTKNLGRFLRSLGWEFQEMIGTERESLALFRWRSSAIGEPPFR